MHSLVVKICSFFPLATPTGSQTPFPPSRSRHVSESFSPATSPYGGGGRGGYRTATTSLTPTPTAHSKQLKISRQKSTSESGNPTHSLSTSFMRHLSSPLGHKIKQTESRDMIRIRKDSMMSLNLDTADTPYGTKGSLNPRDLHPLKFHPRQKSASESQATPTLSIQSVMRGRRGVSVSSESTDGGHGIVGMGSLRRQGSYELATENEENAMPQTREDEDYHIFPVSCYQNNCFFNFTDKNCYYYYVLTLNHTHFLYRLTYNCLMWAWSTTHLLYRKSTIAMLSTFS